MKNEERRKMKKSIAIVMLALFLTLCIGILYITPASNALIYGSWWNLGSINGVGSIGSASAGTVYGVYSLVYAQNHKVYGIAASPYSTHLFSIDLHSGTSTYLPNGGAYPLTMATAATDLGVPLAGAQFTYPWPNNNFIGGGNALTAGYYYSNGFPYLMIYGGGHYQYGPADLQGYIIDTSTWINFGSPPISGGVSLNEAICALTTGTDGTIYGGTGYYTGPSSGTNPGHSDWTYLFAYHPTTGSFTVLFQVPPTLGDYDISSMTTGINGEIYFLSQPSGTLWCYNPVSGTTSNPTGPPRTNMGYTALTVDLYGNLWLCDNFGWLYEYPFETGVVWLQWSPIVTKSPTAPLYTYEMAAGMHGIIYMTVSDPTTNYGYFVWYDPRAPWSLGALGTNSRSGENPASANIGIPAGTGPYSLVECNEHGLIFCGTGGVIQSSQLFYYYEAGNPDIINIGQISGRQITLVAREFGMVDPPGAGLPLILVAAAVIAVAAVASVYKLGSRAKRKKR
jgi:hypothetical protein